MQIVNIIKNACVFLQKDDLIKVVELGGDEVSTDEQKRELNILLRCLNLVYNQIATDYIPLIHTEKIATINGEFLLKNFDKKIIDIKKVEDKFGIKTTFKLYPDKILTINGEISITYTYQPEELININSEMESFSEKVSERVMSYGLAMEYSFISGLYDDALIWEKRFKDGLKIASRNKSDMKLPPRRWNR